MLRLRNIKIHDVVAKAEYSPEDSGWWGHIEVDLKNEEIISCERNPDYGDAYPGHSLWALVDIYKSNSTENERLVMWY